MANQTFEEGRAAKTLEKQTAKIPSDVYLWTSIGTMLVSLGLFIAKKRAASMFIGQWAPSLLIIGLYNKLVKVEGHDQTDKGTEEPIQKKSRQSRNESRNEPRNEPSIIDGGMG